MASVVNANDFLSRSGVASLFVSGEGQDEQAKRGRQLLRRKTVSSFIDPKSATPKPGRKADSSRRLSAEAAEGPTIEPISLQRALSSGSSSRPVASVALATSAGGELQSQRTVPRLNIDSLLSRSDGGATGGASSSYGPAPAPAAHQQAGHRSRHQKQSMHRKKKGLQQEDVSYGRPKSPGSQQRNSPRRSRAGTADREVAPGVVAGASRTQPVRQRRATIGPTPPTTVLTPPATSGTPVTGLSRSDQHAVATSGLSSSSDGRHRASSGFGLRSSDAGAGGGGRRASERDRSSSSRKASVSSPRRAAAGSPRRFSTQPDDDGGGNRHLGKSGGEEVPALDLAAQSARLLQHQLKRKVQRSIRELATRVNKDDDVSTLDLEPPKPVRRLKRMNSARGLLQKNTIQSIRREQRNDDWWYAINDGRTDDVLRMLAEHQGDRHLHRIDVNASDFGGGDCGSALHLACQNGHIDVVRILLERGAHTEAVCMTERPLHLAGQNGRPDVIRLLLEFNAYINARTGSQWTPLHFASMNGHLAAVKLLIERGAAVNAVTNFYHRHTETPLHVAVKSSRVGCVRALLKGGANRHYVTRAGVSVFDLAKGKPLITKILNTFALDKQPHTLNLGQRIRHCCTKEKLSPRPQEVQNRTLRLLAERREQFRKHHLRQQQSNTTPPGQQDEQRAGESKQAQAGSSNTAPKVPRSGHPKFARRQSHTGIRASGGKSPLKSSQKSSRLSPRDKTTSPRNRSVLALLSPRIKRG